MLENSHTVAFPMADKSEELSQTEMSKEVFGKQ